MRIAAGALFGHSDPTNRTGWRVRVGKDAYMLALHDTAGNVVPHQSYNVGDALIVLIDGTGYCNLVNDADVRYVGEGAEAA